MRKSRPRLTAALLAAFMTLNTVLLPVQTSAAQTDPYGEPSQEAAVEEPGEEGLAAPENEPAEEEEKLQEEPAASSDAPSDDPAEEVSEAQGEAEEDEGSPEVGESIREEESGSGEEEVLSESSADAYGAPEEEYTYVVKDDGTIKLTAYSGTDAEIVIPERIEGAAVTELGEALFQNKTFITGLTLNEGLETIGANAFSGCNSLSGTLTLPDSLVYIGAGAFNGCAFTGSLVIPDGVSMIRNQTFSNTKFTEATIGSGCAIIGESSYGTPAFNNVPLTKVTYRCAEAPTIRNTGSLFSDRITAIFIPAGSAASYYSRFGGQALKGRLRTTGSQDDLTAEDGVVYGCQAESGSIQIPEGIREIAPYAFYNKGAITSMTMAGTVTTIGDYAFSGCSSLVMDMGFMENVTSIGISAFAYCSKISGSLCLNDAVARIPDNAFRSCTGLTGSLTLPEGLTQIGKYAFYDCGFTGTLILPDHLVSLGERSFNSCEGFTGELYLPDSITSAGSYAFSSCSGFTSLRLSENLTLVSENAFAFMSGLQGTLTIPASVARIQAGGFYGLNNVSEVIIRGNALIWTYFSSSTSYYNAFGFSRAVRLVFETETVPRMCTSENASNPYIYASRFSYAFPSLQELVVPISAYSSYKRILGPYLPAGCRMSADDSSDPFVMEEGVLVGYLGSEPSVEIPASVSALGPYAFSGCTQLEEVILTDRITEISEGAFSGCTSLYSVTGMGNLTRIGEKAFYNCSSLQWDPSGFGPLAEIGSYAFYNCSSMAGNLSLTGPVLSIGEYAFYGCSGLTGLTLPEDLTRIGNYAFYNCTALTGSLVLPEGLLEIGGAAFYGDKNLTGALVIPDTVTVMGGSAFLGCTGFTSLILSENLTVMDREVFSGCSGLEGALIIPDAVTAIRDNAFSGCNKLTSVTFGSGTAFIYVGAYRTAFFNCGGVTEVTFLGEVPPVLSTSETASASISGYAAKLFGNSYGMRYVTDIYIPSGTYPAYAEAFASALSSTIRLKGDMSGDMVIEDGVLLSYMGQESSVTVPDTVTSIGPGAFMNNTALQEIVFEGSITSIGEKAFYGCTGLTGAFLLPQGLTSIGTEAFSGCSGITGDLVIPDSVTQMGERAFKDCSGLDGILTISQSLTTLSSGVFSGCRNLQGEVFVPDAVTNVYGQAFYNCQKITSIRFGTGVDKFYSLDSFTNGCSSLKEITFTGPLPSAFSSRSALVQGSAADTIWVPAEYYQDYKNAFGRDRITKVRIRVREGGDFILDESGTCLIGYNGTSPQVVIPEGVTRIGNYAFLGSRFICSVSFPSSLTEIGDYAFYYCTDLTGDLILPDTVTSIGIYTFYGCSFSGYLNLPASLLSIGAYAFGNCTGFQGGLDLGNSLQTIGSYAFYRCGGFSDEVLRIPDSVTSIGEYAFYGMKFTGVELSESLTSVSSYLFSECRNLKEIVLPDSVRFISYNAFSFCTALEKVTFGSGFQTLYQGSGSSPAVFSGCSSLREIEMRSDVPVRFVINPDAAEANYEEAAGAFNIPSLERIIVPAGSYDAWYAAIGNYLPDHVQLWETGADDYTIENGVLIRYCGQAAEFEIPAGVTEIGDGAFAGNRNLQSVIIPDSVIRIGNRAFAGCSALTEAALPGGLEIIGDNAFAGCVSLPSLELPGTLTSIGACAFRSDSGLSGDLSLPEGLTSLGQYAFYDCSGLTGTLVIPDRLTVLPDYAFYGCQGFTRLDLGSGVTEIGAFCLSGCSGLTGTLVIPDQVKTIRKGAVRGCSGIESMIIGSGIELLESNNVYLESCICNNAALASITFTGTRVPDIGTGTSLNQDYIIRSFFGSSVNPVLTTIYCRQSMLEAFRRSWGAYLKAGMSISSNTMVLPVTGLAASYVTASSASLKWDASINENITGYYVYRDGERIGDVSLTEFAETGLTDGRTYIYSVTGHTLEGEETAAAELSVRTGAPVILSVYTDNALGKVGYNNSYIYALAEHTSSMQGASGSFTYLDRDGNTVRIGEISSAPFKVTEEGLVYRTEWDLEGMDSGVFSVTFTLTDTDGGSGLLTQDLTVDTSRPARLSSVIAVGDTNQIIVSWSLAHEIDTGRYHIYRMAEDEEEYILYKKIYSRTQQSYTDTTARQGVKYYYYVVGVNDFGVEGLPSNTAMAYALTDTESPQVVQITPVNMQTIGGVCTLRAQATDNVAVVKTELYISRDQGETWDLLSETDSSYSACTLDTSLLEDTAVRVRALAYDAAGNVSSPLIYTYTVDNTGPGKVTGVHYESTSQSITLHWNDVEDADFKYFSLEVMQEDGSFMETGRTSTTLGYSMTGLTPDTGYVCRVAAYDQMGNRGQYSEVIECRTLADTDGPVVTDMKPDACFIRDRVTVRITARDSTAVSSIRIQISPDAVSWQDYAEISFDGSSKAETAVCTIELADYSAGAVYVRGVGTDPAGNVGNEGADAPYVQYLIDQEGPAKPVNFAANPVAGAIELTWDQGPEEDLDGYNLYRSEDGEDYVIIASGLCTVNYVDRNIERDTTYTYKLAARDQAGNLSEMAGPVSGMLLLDTIPPEILSIVPGNGTVLGPSNAVVRVAARDNWRLASTVVTYTVNDRAEEYTLIRDADLGRVSSAVSESSLPLTGFADGDTLHLRVVVTDMENMSVTDNSITYTIDKQAPRVADVSAVGDESAVTVSWTGFREEDLAGYRIYRRAAEEDSFRLIGSRSASNADTTWKDIYADAGITYFYRVEAVDIYGNTYARESGAAFVIAVPVTMAIMHCTLEQETDVDYYFDASDSYADLGIASYTFDFGDGTEPLVTTDPVQVHRYSAAGRYSASLTVTDTEGTTNTDVRPIEVEDAKMYGQVHVTVVDGNGSRLSDVPVYYDLEGDMDKAGTTDAYGSFTFSAVTGQYLIGAYKDGYLPVSRSLVVRAGAELEIRLILVKEPIVTGEFEVTRMTLEEIEAAGIDVYDPANQQVVKLRISLHYGTVPVVMDITTNGSRIYSGTTTIVDTDAGQRQLQAVPITVETPPSESQHQDHPAPRTTIIAIMDTPVQMSYLKEFFDVKLHIVNNADSEYALTGNTVTLNLPEGLSLAQTGQTGEGSTAFFDILPGQEEKTISWTVRGDQAGSYSLSADYHAVLSVFNTDISARFETQEPIVVNGTRALQVTAELNNTVRYGNLYFNLSMKNMGTADMNLPSIGFADQVLNFYKGTAVTDDGVSREITVLDRVLTTASGTVTSLGETELTSLRPGETYTVRYAAYNGITEDDLRYLDSAIVYIAGSQHITYRIYRSNWDMYQVSDADQTAADIEGNPEKQHMYQYLLDPDRENFYYYNQAMSDEDALWAFEEEAGVKEDLLVTLDHLPESDADLDTVARGLVTQILQDEAFKSGVDSRMSTIYLRVTEDLLGQVTDLAGSEEIAAALADPDAVRTWSVILRQKGPEGLYASILATVRERFGEDAGSTLLDTVPGTDFDLLTGDAIKAALPDLTDVTEAVSSCLSEWYISPSAGETLIRLQASHSETLALLDHLTGADLMNEPLSENLAAMRQAVALGFASKGQALAAELMETEENTSYSVRRLTSKLNQTMGGLYYWMEAGPAISSLADEYGGLDLSSGWMDRVNALQTLRSTALLGRIFEESSIEGTLEGDHGKAIRAYEYMIFAKLLGEKAFVKLAEAGGQADRILAAINAEQGTSYRSLDSYLQYLQQRVTGYRDQIFSETLTETTIPEAPEVNIDYASETTQEVFDGSFEYSFDGENWTACGSSVIALSPGHFGRHLWVRKAETDENRAGNIAKIYIPGRKRVSGPVKARYKDGICSLEGLMPGMTYVCASDCAAAEDPDQCITFAADEFGKADIELETFSEKLWISSLASASAFRSYVRELRVLRAVQVAAAWDDARGRVIGAGEYYTDDTVHLIAVPDEGCRFMGWYDLNGDLVTEETEYGFTVGTEDVSLEAVFVMGPYRTVRFLGMNGNLLSERVYEAEQTTEADIEIPSVPPRNGYAHTGWELNGRKFTGARIGRAVLDAMSDQLTLDVNAVYSQKQETYLCLLEGGHFTDGSTRRSFRAGDQVTVTADAPPVGKKFAYWTKDSIIISYNETCSFTMNEKDAAAAAVFVEEDEEMETRGVSYIESVTPDFENQKLSFVAINTLPEGGTFISAGLVATDDPEKAEDLTVDNADYVKYSNNLGTRTSKFTWTKTRVTGTWYVRSHMVYLDAEGNEHEMYGRLVSGKLQVTVDFLAFNGVVLSEQAFEYQTDYDLHVPAIVARDGYSVVGWALNGQIYSESEIADVITALFDAGKGATLHAVYEQKDEYYHLTVEGGKTAGGNTEESVQVASYITVQADPAPEGMKFAYWKKDADVVSYSEKCGFYMPGYDCVVTACYVEEEEEIVQKGVAYIQSVTPSPDQGKITFVSICTVPTGYTTVKAGLVATSDELAAQDLTAENAAYVKLSNVLGQTTKLTWTKSKVTAPWTVRAYLVYSDGAGVEYTVYGDPVTADLTGIID